EGCGVDDRNHPVLPAREREQEGRDEVHENRRNDDRNGDDDDPDEGRGGIDHLDRGGNVARAGYVRELVLSAVFKTVCGVLLERPGWVRFPSIPARFQHTTVSAGSVAAEIGTALAQE